MIPAPSPPETSTAAGIYVHVPFCVAKCHYCDFYSVSTLNRIPDYLEALLLEIDQCNAVLPDVDTLYFGGGTPSVLLPRQIERIITHLKGRFSVDPASEITMEVNPGTVTPEKLAGYRSAGINRLNIGFQSLSDLRLRQLGRIHSVRQGLDTLHWARQKGFENIGLDFIYGIPNQSERQWRTELSQIVELGVQHLSCYTLTVEPGTPMSVKVKDREITPLNEAVTGALFSLTREFLDSHDYRQYEVSNYARVDHSGGNDYRSRHNRKYWTFAPYLGFGPSAHSYMDNRRWWNTRSLEAYLEALQSATSPIADEETLSREQQIVEFVYLSLRQTVGIDTIDFESRFDLNFYRWYEHEISLLLNEELIELHHQWIRTTPRGMLLLDQVVERLIG